ncbi:MAG TPA: hypothetical protein VMU32_06105 [Solirubrobacteraceae bacterium]|nr:hypothetical protein [Solirubrobacteraceae bacterium]
MPDAVSPARRGARRPGTPPAAALAAAIVVAAAALAGCGKSLPTETVSRGAGVATVASSGAVGPSGLVMENTTRIGGAEPVADAAASALAAYPGLTPATRPEAVVLVDEHDWAAALAACALASAPLGAPLLYAEGDSLPATSAQALATMKPRGSRTLGGAQVIELGTTAAPAGYRTLRVSAAAGAGPATLAAAVVRLLASARGSAPRRVIVAGVDGPPALAMPAAALAAETGAPILPVGARGLPPATRQALRGLRRPTIYAVGPPAAVGHTVLAELARLGPVRRIYDPAPVSGATPAGNAVAVARYRDGPFGWGVEEPGHGFLFANATRPLDAPATAALAAGGAPLLLLEGPDGVPAVLRKFLSDVQPGYPEYQPTRGFYNRGWVVGDERAITATAQAKLDAMLASVPQSQSQSPPTQESEAP